MIKYIIFNNIKFINLKKINSNFFLEKRGLLVFPAAPALTMINNNKDYHRSLIEAEYVFFDSGYFVLLLKFLKKINVSKLSGYRFLKYFFKFLKSNKNQKIFCIDPTYKVKKINIAFFKKMGIKNLNNYLAPIYKKKINDKKLLKKLNKIKPNYIITNLGGGTQEILGLYIKKNIKFKTTIICTGGAISYFTGEQAPINKFIDNLYLGWLIRIIFSPKIFF